VERGGQGEQLDPGGEWAGIAALDDWLGQRPGG